MSRHVNVAVRKTRVRARMTADTLNGDQQIEREIMSSRVLYIRASCRRENGREIRTARGAKSNWDKNMGESVMSRETIV